MSVDVDIKWLEDFTRRLSGLEIKTKRIPLAELWIVFAETFRHRPDTAKRRLWLLDCLLHAERKNIIVFPKTVWERVGEPALPKYVERVLETPATKNAWWKAHCWHSALEWAADLVFLTDEQQYFLRRVDQGLKENWFEQPAPLNRRSVELTGKEKRLKKHLNSSLFGEDRLSRALLNITSDVTPLAYEFVGTKPVALVFENREPFNVARSVLENLSAAPYGILAYGGGNCFADSVRDFLRIQSSIFYQTRFTAPLEQIHYVGDLDWAGLSIALRVGLTARKYNLPPVIPATGIHRAMLDSLHDPRIAHPDGFPNDETKKTPLADSSLVEWLPADVRDEIRRVLNLNNRIPEEMLTAETLFRLWS